MYKWKIVNKKLDQTKLVEDIYTSRGVSNYQKLFNLDEKDLNDSYQLKDMKKSVDRIMMAVESNEKILIYGDYDVDGITSTYILFKTLYDLGANIYYDIPNRFVDGYGLSYSKVYDIINDEFNLVITVDNGIKSVFEANVLKENGVDLIITDHHEQEGTLPNAYSIIHTALSDYPFKPLAGVGVAFKLSQALIGDDALDYIDIVALGTIADMMPLIDENRAIVNLGLKKLIASDNIGLSKLISFLDLKHPSVADVQYKIAPRLNACGRMKSAKLAVRLLLSENNQIALKIVEEIEEINNKRKKLSNMLFAEAISQLKEDEPTIIIHSPIMHEGVLGIIASRLANEYSKVSIVLKEEEFTFKGSIRSYGSVDIIYVLSEIKDLLVRYGGHRNAAGLEFKKENFSEFKRKFNELVPKAQREEFTVAEGEINISKLDINQIFELDRYDLKDSLFVFPNVSVESKYLIKGEHSKILINATSEAIFFNNKNLHSKINRSSKITLLGRLDVNTFRGRSKKQILIEDFELN